MIIVLILINMYLRGVSERAETSLYRSPPGFTRPVNYIT
jgi:hypothetical protein